MDLTVGKFLRFLVALFFIFVIGWLLYALSEIITIIVVGALLAYILDPIVSILEAKGLSRLLATLIIFLAVILIMVVGAWILIPNLITELSSVQITLQSNLPATADSVSHTADSIQNDSSGDFIAQIENYIRENMSFINVDELNLKGKIDSLKSSLSKQLLALAANIFSIISALVIIPFVTFFLLKDGREMKKLLVSWVPNRYFEMTLNVLHKVDQQLGGYLRGQFIEAFVVGILAIIALWILDVKYFVLIGAFAGLANMIPYVGPVAGAVPAIIVALANGADLSIVIYIAIAFTLIQLNDNVIMQPLVLSRSVNLHPLLIVLAVLIGGQFFGLLGMVLDVPAAGIIKVTSSEIYNGIKKFNLM